MRGIFSILSDFSLNVRADLKEFANRHFDFFHEGWTPRGLFTRVPGTRFSAMLEWHTDSKGWAWERQEGCFEVWCGRFQGTFCREMVNAA